MVLDSTSGPYWDDATQKEVTRQPLPYNYWATHPFPVVQYWAYYNDTYYKEVGGPNNSPQAWNSTANAYDSGIEESFSTASLSTAEEEIASIISDVVADNNTQDTTPVNDNGNNSVANNSNNTDLTSNNNSADNTNTQDDSVTNNADNGAKTNQGLPTGLIVGAVILVIVVLCAVVIFKGKK
jgi:hypothetical protein